MTEKRCASCNTTKSIDCFSPRQRSCKLCVAASARAKRLEFKASGLCQQCGGPIDNGKRTCEACLKDARVRYSLIRSYLARTNGAPVTRPGAWVEIPTERTCKTCGVFKPITEFGEQNFHRNLGRPTYRHHCKPCEAEKSRIRVEKYYSERLCVRCGRVSALPGHSRCAKCRERDKESRLRLRAAVLLAYGKKCANCGDDRVECLTMDHVDGWGKDHVTKKGRRVSGYSLWKWARDNGYPPSLRLLCGSCHVSVSAFGSLPRKLKRGDKLEEVTRISDVSADLLPVASPATPTTAPGQ